MTAFCQHQLRPIKSAVLADADISVKSKYRPIYRSISTQKSEMVKRSITKAKTKTKDENSTLIVNSLLFFMNHRHKSTAVDSTFQMMLNYYNEETISEAKALLHNTIAPEKGLIKRKGVGKARETLKDIHHMIIELDADPNNSIRLVTETTDFPSLDLKHIDATSLCHKIIQLRK